MRQFAAAPHGGLLLAPARAVSAAGAEPPKYGEQRPRPVVAPALRHRFVFIINRYIDPPLFFVSLLRIEPRLRPTGTAETNLLLTGNDRGTIYATGLRTFILIARNHEQDRRIVGRQGRIPALPHLQNHRQEYVAPSLPAYRRGGMGSLRPQYPDVEQPQRLLGHGRLAARATFRSCPSTRASNTPPARRSPPIRSTSIPKISSGWRSKAAATA